MLRLKPQLSLAFFLVTLCGCGGSPGQKYVVQTLKITGELSQAGERMGLIMQPWFQGGQLDPHELDMAERGLSKTVASIETRIKALTVPSDAKSQEFARVLGEYVAWQREVLPKFKRWADTAKAENPASEATLQQVIDEMIALNDEELVWKARIDQLAEGMGVTIKAQP